jgi:hypothetical protein
VSQLSAFAALAIAALAIAALGCGTEPPSYAPDAGMCMPYVVPASTNLMTPTVSFKTDVVIGVFNTKCSSGVCHGETGNPTVHNLFLGNMAQAGSDADMVYTGLVGVMSTEDSAMDLVKASSDSDSYLMHKLDGDQCMYQSACSGSDCMSSMPSGANELIDVSSRDTVRRWIAQGAMNN